MWPKLIVQTHTHTHQHSHTGFIYLLCSTWSSPKPHLLISQLSHPALQVDLPSKQGDYFTHFVLTWCLKCTGPLPRNTHMSEHLALIMIIFTAGYYFSVITVRRHQRHHIRLYCQENMFSNFEKFCTNRKNIRHLQSTHSSLQSKLIQFKNNFHDCVDQRLMTAETTMELMLGLQQSQKPFIWLDYYKLNHTCWLTVFTIFTAW